MSYGKIYETTWWGNPIDGGWGDIYFDLTGTAETAFVFDVKTDNTGTSNNDQFTLPLVSSFNGVTAEVDWGDGSTDTITAYNQPEVTHTYASAGTYTIKISNALRGFKFEGVRDSLKLLNISNWGVLEINTSDVFNGCANMTCTATDVPTISTNSLRGTFLGCSSFNGVVGNWDVSGVNSMKTVFKDCSAFNQPLDSWDVSNVTEMLGMFNAATSFNQPLNSWNTSSVTTMREMFEAASAFNSAIDNWDVSSVTTMQDMFFNAIVFNQPLNSWDVSSVTNMENILRSADAFNQDLNSWDVSSVTNMVFAFAGADVFNGNIGSWNVSSVTNMSELFRNSDSFNQSLSNWDVGNVTHMIRMFRDNDIFDQDLSSWNIVKVAFATDFMVNAGGFSVANYDATLIGWEATLQAAFPSGTGYTLTPVWNFGSSQYTSGGAAATARASLVSNFNWTIIDGGTA